MKDVAFFMKHVSTPLSLRLRKESQNPVLVCEFEGWRAAALSWPDIDREENSRRRAAQYVRMSTEHQRYSTENRADAIQRYADERGYQIIRTYSDAGKSDLRIQGRAGLTQLIEDIEDGQTEQPDVCRRL